MSRFGIIAIFTVVIVTGTTACGQGSRTEQPDYTNPQFLSLTDVRYAPPAIQNAAKGIVKLEPHPGGSGGTGAFISLDGLLMTNNHLLGVNECAKSGCYVSVSWSFAAGEKADIRTIFVVPKVIAPELDLAILQAYEVAAGTKGAKLNVPAALEFAPTSAAALVGHKIYLVGHPDLGLKKWSTGEIYSAQDNTIRADGFSLPGSSGSPMLDETGKIIGLLYAATTQHDAITRGGIRHDSIGTASGPIVDALQKINWPEPPGLSLVFDTSAPLDRDTFLANTQVFLHAHIREIPLLSAPTPPTVGNITSANAIDIIGDYLDSRLSGPHEIYDANGLALLQGLISDAFYWIDCDAGTDTTYTLCPSAQDKTKWSDRSEKLFSKSKTISGRSDLYWLALPKLGMETSLAAGKAAALATVLAHADQTKLDAGMADWIIYLTPRGQNPTFAGQDLRAYILNYRQIPHYWNSFSPIVGAMSGLFYANLITAEELATNLTAIISDPDITLGERIRAERAAYWAGVLE